MKADTTRVTFDPIKHYSRVLKQQGRITLDADDNEQTAILLHYLRTLARDLIGPHAAPKEGGGFALSWDPNRKEIQISKGRYYVDGILVENEVDCLYTAQPDYPLLPDDKLSKENRNDQEMFWIYLDVWERHITPIEDDAIREKALGGPDTCTRSKVVWQVKAIPPPQPSDESALKAKSEALQEKLKKTTDPTVKQFLLDRIARVNAQIASLNSEGVLLESICNAPLNGLVSVSEAMLAARIDPGLKNVDACVTPPKSKYRGVENHLYRVEIHGGGEAGIATFKWSRDNGSGASAWLGTFGQDLQVANSRGFAADTWVELSDDTHELQGVPGVMVKLAKVEGDRLSVDPGIAIALAWSKELVNPKVRQWNQIQTDNLTLHGGVVSVNEAAGVWIDLEDGIQIQFLPGGDYRSGDYWLIPARFSTGQIEWPGAGTNQPQALPPAGVRHYYAPLGFATWNGEKFNLEEGCRCEFEPIGCTGSESDSEDTHGVAPMDFAAKERESGGKAAPSKKTGTGRQQKKAGIPS